jgi:hypothetical protein
MAAPRAYWKGYLKLSLVTCPVALYPASRQSEKTHSAVVAVRRRSPSVTDVRRGVGVRGRRHIVAIGWGVVRIGHRVPISTVIPSVPHPFTRGDLNACITYSRH